MKALFYLLVVCLVSVFSFAEEVESPFGATIYGSVESQYIGLRVSKQIDDGPILFGGLTLVYKPSGLWLDAWNARDFDSGEPEGDFGDEIDLSVGWSGQIGKFGTTIQVVHFNLNPLDDLWDGDIFAHGLMFGRQFRFGDHALVLQARVEYLMETDNWDGGALLLMPNVQHRWEFAPGLMFKQVAMFVWDDGFDLPGNDSDGMFLRYMPSVHWQITPNLMVTAPGMTILQPLNNTEDDHPREVSWGFGLHYTF